MAFVRIEVSHCHNPILSAVHESGRHDELMSSNNRKRPREFKARLWTFSVEVPWLLPRIAFFEPQRLDPSHQRLLPEFQLALTRAILDFHFRLEMPSLPAGRLCPPVPNRWVYRWMSGVTGIDAFLDWTHYTLRFHVVTKDYRAWHWKLCAPGDFPPLACQSSKRTCTCSQAKLIRFQLNQPRSMLKQISLKIEWRLFRSKALVRWLDLFSAGIRPAHDVASLDFVVWANPPFYDERPPERADG
jgi:hypothetical protein